MRQGLGSGVLGFITVMVTNGGIKAALALGIAFILIGWGLSRLIHSY